MAKHRLAMLPFRSSPMNAMTYGDEIAAYVDVRARTSTSTLDRTALAAGAAARKGRLLEIEATMDQACEAAVRRKLPHQRTGPREAWDRPAWNAYVDEATHQAMLHAREMTALCRDIQRLEHLASCAP